MNWKFHETTFYDATDTNFDCFVFASAGSGKTKVLVDRYVKLLLLGNSPSSILCITFTNAATREMQDRISTILKQLAIGKDDFVSNYLQYEMNIGEQSKELLDRARNLFTEFVDDNTNITTVHSFCHDLLQRFPFEAEILPDFKIIDGILSKEYLSLARDQFFKELFDSSDNSVISSISNIISSYAFEGLLEKMLNTLPKFYRFFERNSDISEYESTLRRLFRIVPEIPVDLPPSLARMNYSDVEDMFLTKTGSIRKNIKSFPENEALKIANAMHHNRNNRNKEKTLQKTIGFLLLTKKIFDKYQEIKQTENALDFADIIHKADNLLKTDDSVLSMTRSRIRHIMIDEAQDMNSDQWRIISYLGATASTLFAVGDIKQSIYNFQDANPQLFLDFHRLYKESGRTVKTVNLDTCYRSRPRILELVNRVFSTIFEGYNKHIPYRDDQPGVAEMVLIGEAADGAGGGNCIASYPSISDLVERLVEEGSANPGDIMILTRKRSSEVSEIIAELQNRGFQVAGPDRTSLNKALVIMDIIAAAEFAINNDDDYALACLLKSNYIFDSPLDESSIFDLCHDRDCSLFENLKKNERFNEQAAILFDIIDAANSKSVQEFFYHLAFVVQNNDEPALMNSFLETVMKYNKTDSIIDFITWFNSNNIEIPSTTPGNTNSNKIVVNTIHGSKGLEAPVVILLDFSLKSDISKSKFLWKETITSMQFIVRPNASETFSELQDLIDLNIKAEEDDLLRLMYVAMTRARDRLYIAYQLPIPEDTAAETILQNYVACSNSSRL
ncbi:MAG: UvrD-helicase domain-containing protein [Holosporales bacterium]|nr:UvrD-helicase domain-containing protein [Holosporales bacterium]